MADDERRGTEVPLEAVSPLHIVVVEHRDDVRRSVCDLLKRLGHRAWGAVDLEEALHAASLGCDMVLSDASMPPVGGLRILEAVHERHPEALGALMSGGEIHELEAEGLWAGSVPFIDKPVTTAALQKLISLVRCTRVLA